MKVNKEVLITGFALFALFFGAGNLILPPFLGFFAGSQWYLVALGFIISAVGLPLLGILAHARLQGSIFSFADKVSPLFSLVFCFLIYLISVALPAPRTAAVTHEIAIEPFFEVSSLTTSILYFLMVFFFVIKRSSIINNIGKYLTPAILVLLLAIIFSGIFSGHDPLPVPLTRLPVITGFFEGYQTFDAIAALVVGGVIIVSVKLNNPSGKGIGKIISSSALLAGFGLLIVYMGLIYNGAIVNSEFEETVTRTELLRGISFINLGGIAQFCLAVLVALACFTTAVGITTGTADFIAERIPRPYVYEITVFLTCAVGVVMGALSVNDIIEIALPVLLLIYPLTIVLILINLLPERLRTAFIMRATVSAVILFSLPDALRIITSAEIVATIHEMIPLSNFNLGWVIPAFVVFILASIFQKKSGGMETASVNK